MRGIHNKREAASGSGAGVSGAAKPSGGAAGGSPGFTGSVEAGVGTRSVGAGTRRHVRPIGAGDDAKLVLGPGADGFGGGVRVVRVGGGDGLVAPTAREIAAQAAHAAIHAEHPHEGRDCFGFRRRRLGRGLSGRIGRALPTYC